MQHIAPPTFTPLPTMLLALGLAALATSCGGDEPVAPETHVVRRGSVAREAIAVGKIQPRVQVPVHSAWGGVVTRRTIAVGDRVEAGDRLVEVRPLLTERDRLEAQRRLKSAQEGWESAVELSSGKNIMGRAMGFLQGASELSRMRAQADRARQSTETELKLLVEGEAEDAGLVLDWFVRAPISGTVAELPVELGQPMTPASTYGAGTLILTIADLERPVFRGTVDELDVGQLRPGAQAELDVGALPGVAVAGTLREISLIARPKNDSSVFDVIIDVKDQEGLTLRAGYSAVARISIARAEDALVIPERLVNYSNDEGTLRATVNVQGPDGEPTETPVETGVSDGLKVEITSGLAEGTVLIQNR